MTSLIHLMKTRLGNHLMVKPELLSSVQPATRLCIYLFMNKFLERSYISAQIVKQGEYFLHMPDKLQSQLSKSVFSHNSTNLAHSQSEQS